MIARELFAQKRTEVYGFLKQTKEDSWKTRCKKFKTWSVQTFGKAIAFGTLYNEARRAGWWPEEVRGWKRKEALAASKKPVFITQYDPKRNQMATVKALINLDLPPQTVITILRDLLNG